VCVIVPESVLPEWDTGGGEESAFCSGAEKTQSQTRSVPQNGDQSPLHALLAGFSFCNTHQLPVVIVPARS
jgi:hypothetical protein